MSEKIAILGAGLSGLTTAYLLAKRGVDFQLFEARERFGGRILTLDSKRSTARFDLGPSWFWPGQSNIETLIRELELEHLVFHQFSDGDAIYEPHGAPIQRGVNGISMAGSYRLIGGMGTLVEALVKIITKLGFGDNLHLSSPVSMVSDRGKQLLISGSFGELAVDKLILALPVRVGLETIRFDPKFSEQRQRELDAVSTWMAGHAKVVAEFEKPFWRHSGLSGDVISQVGPMSEIHDACSEKMADETQAFALFGFLGIEPRTRKAHSEELEELVLAQLVRLFGKEAVSPINLLIQDWAQEVYTASEHDQFIPNHHPNNHWTTTLEPDWRDSVIWSGSETTSDHTNGYLEGAVGAGYRAVKQLDLTD